MTPLLMTLEAKLGQASIGWDEMNLLPVDGEETEVKTSNRPLAGASIGHWASAGFLKWILGGFPKTANGPTMWR